MDVLLLEQGKRKEINSRKTAIAEIMLEYCSQWIKHKDSIQEAAIVPTISGQDNNSMVLQKLTLAPTSTDLLIYEKKLEEKEEVLRTKEVFINRNRTELENDRMRFFAEKEDLIRIKEENMIYMYNAREEVQKSIENKTLYRISQNEITQKNDIIYKKDKEIESLKKDILKSLKTIEDNTKKNIFTDYILPSLPLLANIIGSLILNKKITKMEELKPIVAEIGENIKAANIQSMSDIEKTLGNKDVKSPGLSESTMPSGGFIN